MSDADYSDVLIVGALVIAVFAYFYRKRITERKLKEQAAATRKLNGPSRPSGASSTHHKKAEGKDMIIFFGSQTGTAEDYATRIAREAKQYGFDPIVADFENYAFTSAEEARNLFMNKLVFIVAATYGEGEPTDNAQEAYRFFKEETFDEGVLNGINYVVFGLGNKTYEQYNVIGQFWDTKLEQLGATRAYTMGLGDDDGNLEEDFLQWKECMWPAVCARFNKNSQAHLAITRQFTLTEHGAGEIPAETLFKGEHHSVILAPATQARGPYDMKNPYYAETPVNRELMRAGTDRSCMHIEVKIEGTPLSYLTGDHLGIYPANDPSQVERLIRALRIPNPDSVFSFAAIDPTADKQSPFPSPCSYRTALTYYLDICAHPRTHIIKALAENAGTDADRKEFEHLASAEGKEAFNRYVSVGCRTLAEILEEHPNTHMPVDLILELLPRLQCRYYSIASSAKQFPGSVHICATLVEYQTPTGRHARGIATGWLSNRRALPSPPPPVPVFIRKSNFKLPGAPSRSVIMIGPGTGVAPFRGFIQERAFHRQAGKPVGATVLFFGCRTPAEFLYEDELREHETQGNLELHVAFSRVEGQPKQYVQHLFVQERKRMWELISEGAYLYVCGDAKNMARDVHRAIIEMVRDCGGKTEEEATKHVKQMRSTNRYLEDVWS